MIRIKKSKRSATRRQIKRREQSIRRRKPTKKLMARSRIRRRGRRIGRRASRGLRRIGAYRGKFGGILKTGLIGDTTQALGAGLLVGAVTDRVMPQVTPYATLGAEYLAGGVGGMALAEGVKTFIGMPSVLTGLLGGLGIGGTSQTVDAV